MENNSQNTTKKKKWWSWRVAHKWTGIIFSIFIIIFCASGILVNHRQLLRNTDVNRSWMPSKYQLKNWNQGTIKGSLHTKQDGLLIYGQGGIWKTNRTLSHFTPLDNGLPEGMDCRKISNLVQSNDGTLWCASTYEAYFYDRHECFWQPVYLPNNNDRIADIVAHGNKVIVLTRSFVYTASAPDYNFTRHELPSTGHEEEGVTLYRVIRHLHSGALFGSIGRYIVDILAIVIIIICLTGDIFFIFHRSKVKENMNDRSRKKIINWNLIWHDRFGRWTIALTLLIAITGVCLRQPLMYPLNKLSMPTIPGTSLYSENIFNDCLRNIRWDEDKQMWLLYTSFGFYHMEETSDGNLFCYPVDVKQPKISAMGVNVLERLDKNLWLVGSFSGLYYWHTDTGESTRWDMSGAKYVAGYSTDLGTTPIVVFDQHNGATASLPPMPEQIASMPIALYSMALEFHSGRYYTAFLGYLSSFAVFVIGLFIVFVLASGYVVHKKSHKRHRSTAEKRADAAQRKHRHHNHPHEHSSFHTER